jgi:hypothetical protein
MYPSARTCLPIGMAALLAACTARTPGPAAAAAAPVAVEIIDDPIPADWEAVVTAADRERLARTGTAWTEGLAAASRRFRTALRDEAELLDPAIALPRPALPPGPYHCRVIKLGGRRAAYATFRPFDCYVEAEGALLTMVKQTGSKRPAGRLWADGESRLVFLGALGGPAADGAAPPYGADPARDLAGYVERVAPFRWRLAVPWPQDGGSLDIYELIPVPPAPGGPRTAP